MSLVAGTVSAQTGNDGAVGYLTWSATDPNMNNLTTPGASNNLYLYLVREGGLSFKGAEIRITWNPAGDGAGCFDRIGLTYKTSAGTTCTYLNRGTAVPVVYTDEPGSLGVAWANNSSLTDCTAGAAVQIQFEFDTCSDPTGCINMFYFALLDQNNRKASSDPAEGGTLTIGNANAMVNGGMNCPTAVEPTSWGRIKALYSR
jgi:hypothetical protein